MKNGFGLFNDFICFANTPQRQRVILIIDAHAAVAYGCKMCADYGV